MKEYLNCGVYEVDLKGTTDASFKGAHPSIIIRKLTEPTFYFIIPLTTYTKEKWEKLRKYGCCKIDSTGSIARIDKMQIRENVDIPKRYMQFGKYIVPTYDEMLKVLEKAKNCFSLSVDKASRAYQKFHSQYTMFDTEWKTFLATQSVDNTKFSIVTVEPLELAYPLKEVKNLTFEDITNILKNSIYFFKLAYNKDGEILQVKLSKKP
ncbi:MAG: hypothetical protein E7353_10290 [Clostridiales bacterium]|nr:hypothetical protein [Clostridiales bacterium]